METAIKETQTFSASGIVLGKLWRGGEGVFPSLKLTSYNKDEIISEAELLVKEGKLTGTGDFDGNIGAILKIETKSHIEYNEKDYYATEYDYVFVGKLTEEQKQFIRRSFLFSEL